LALTKIRLIHYETKITELTPEMISKAKLDWIHIPLSILMALILGLEIYYILEIIKQPFIDSKEKIGIMFIVIPLLYFIFLYRIYRQLKKDISNNLVKIHSGIVTDKKITSTGSGKTIVYKFELHLGNNIILVDKKFYNLVVNGHFVQWGILPLSGVVVYKNIQ